MRRSPVRLNPGRAAFAAGIIWGVVLVIWPSPARPDDAALGIAGRLLNEGRADSALKVVTAALHRDSTQVGLWLALGKIQDARHRQPARMDAYRRALGIKPQSVEARLGLAHAFFDIHRLDSAAAYASAALVSGSGVRAGAFYLLGRVHEQRGALDSAIVYYRSAWRSLPEEPLP